MPPFNTRFAFFSLSIESNFAFSYCLEPQINSLRELNRLDTPADWMQYVQDVDTPIRAFEPLLLLSLLANYNKFEFRNPYRLRLEDFVNESTVQKIVQGLGANCAKCRDSYVLIQDDVEEGWTLSNTLRYIGLGVLAPSRPSTPVQNAEEAKEKFSAL